MHNPELEKRIAAWRRSMGTAAGQRQELLDELEAHLREEVERLTNAGVGEKEAFELALSKLGSPTAVAAEYAKLTGNHRAWWPVKVAQAAAIGGMLLAGALLSGRVERTGLLLASHVWCVIIGYMAMFAIGGLGACYFCGGWLGAGPTQRQGVVRCISRFARAAAILTGIAVVLGMFWARENWGRYWAWDAKETGAVIVIGWALLLSAFEWFKARQDTICVLAVLASAVTAGAWFGVNTKVSSGVVNPLVVLFIGAHFVFLGGVLWVRLLRRPTAGTPT